MAPASITSDISKPLDIHRDLSPAIALNNVFILNHFADTIHIVATEIVAAHCVWEIHFIENPSSRHQTDTVYIR
jgi:hypothetical protein